MPNRIAPAACANLSLTATLLCGAALSIRAPAEQANAQVPNPVKLPLGARELRLADSGTDVKTLNWALRGALLGTPCHGTLTGETDFAVRALQGESGLLRSGVVARPTKLKVGVVP